MATRTTCRICNPFGALQATLSSFVEAGGASLDYVLSVGKIGVLTMTLPATFDDRLIALDGRIGVWRSINGNAPVLDGGAVYLARIFAYATDYTKITAFHVNELYARRIIDYQATLAESSKGATAGDDLIKAFISQNMGSGITGNRQGTQTQADISALLTVQANLSQGASIAKAAAWRNLLDVITEIGNASTQGATYLTSEIVSPTETTLEARTYATVRGVDHRASSGSPVIFSEARGNLANAVLTYDYSQEITVAIAGGQGEGTNRLVRSTIDTTRIASSPFNRRELFVDMSNVSDTTQLQAESDAAVRAGRPQIILTGDLQDTPAATRGIHYDLGDLVTIEHRNRSFDARLDLIHEVLAPTEKRSAIQIRSTL